MLVKFRLGRNYYKELGDFLKVKNFYYSDVWLYKNILVYIQLGKVLF